MVCSRGTPQAGAEEAGVFVQDLKVSLRQLALIKPVSYPRSLLSLLIWVFLRAQVGWLYIIANTQ